MLTKRKPGQSLAEFALVMPILLLLIMGIFDFGRVFFSYAMASNALRSALRNAAVYGYSGEENNYLNCGLMQETIAKTFFVGTPTITIQYEKAMKADDGSTVTFTCAQVDPTQGGDPGLLDNGDMLQIDIINSIQLITPLVSQIAPSLTFEFHGQRTVVADIRLTTRSSGDVDYDGLDDEWEKLYFGDLAVTRGIGLNNAYTLYTGSDDPDSDGCNNGCEQAHGTLPNNPNSDGPDVPSVGYPGDALNDGEEVFRYRTESMNWDTDSDLLSDSDELYGVSVTVLLPDASSMTYLLTSNPLIGDSDTDGLADGEEVHGVTITVTLPSSVTLSFLMISDPAVIDSDADTLTDYQEVYGYTAANGITYYSNPLSGDSDHDGLSDYDEITGNNSNHYFTHPLAADSDGDGLTDFQEVIGITVTDPGGSTHVFFGNPSIADSDGDGLTDTQELLGYAAADGETYFSNPLLTDSDDDRLNDVDEVTGNNARLAVTDPLDTDSDNDGLNDYYEVRYHNTDPNNANSDGPNTLYVGYPGDTLTDYQEKITYWSDPNKWDTFVANCADNLAVQGQCGDGITYGGANDTDGDGIPDGWELSYFSTTSYTNVDNPDSDFCDNMCEFMATTNPADPDTDDDGLYDGPELNGVIYNGNVLFLSPFDPDTDGDGLLDGEEINATYGYLSNPTSSDSDGDRLSDGQEVRGYRTASGATYYSDPTMTDSDGDTISDYNEVTGNTAANGTVYITNPANSDTDSDGLSDGAEQTLHRTSPVLSDTDSDTVTDYEELHGYTAANGTVYTSTPSDSDTDDDGLLDGAEVKASAEYVSSPTLPDTDFDALSDAQEFNGVTVLTQVGARTFRSYPRSTDSDGDLFTDAQEILGYTASNGTKYYSDPLLSDSDADGLSDYSEARGSSGVITDNLKADTDGDTLSDGYEVNTSHTNPNLVDTDGDAVNDGTDAYPLNQPTISISNTTFARPGNSGGTASFTVTVANGNLGQTLTINYRTQDGTGTKAAYCNLQQQSRNDYTCVNTGLLTYTPAANGTSITTITVATLKGFQNTANEFFSVILDSVTLTNPAGSAALGSPFTATGTFSS